MQTIDFKIKNCFWAIVNSSNYKAIRDHVKYDNYMQPQKEILKTAVIPFLKRTITELTNNKMYEYISINKITTKYTKNEKSITITLQYTDTRENIHIIQRIFDKFKIELNNKLCQYDLWIF